MKFQSQFAAALVTLLIPLTLVVAYVTAYFALCDVGTTSVGGTQIGILRIYDFPGVSTVFKPAAMIEERITGYRVRAVRSIYE